MRKKILPGIVIAFMSFVLMFSVFALPASAAASIKKATVSISATYYTYTGKTIKPTVTVKLGKKKLTKDKHYTVSYKNNKSVGKATITVKGKGSYSGTATKSFYIRPKKVTSLKATPYSTKVKLSWSKVTGAKGYQVYKYEDGKWVKQPTVSKTSATVTGLESAKDYKFRVRAYAKSGSKSLYSSAFTVVEATTTIGKATTISAEDITTASAELKWNKVDKADEYRIYLVNEVTNAKKTFTSEETSYTLSGLDSFTDYTVRIRAYNEDKSILGNYSDYYAFKTLPGAVSGLALNNMTAKGATLVWDKMNNVTGYEVQGFEYDAAGKEKAIVKATVKTNAYVINNLTPYVQYAFKVRPYVKTSDGNVYGEFAETGKFTSSIAKVENFTADEITNKTIKLKWSAVSGATGYKLFMNNQQVVLSSPTATEYTAAGLSESTSYNFYIKAYFTAEDGLVHETDSTVLSNIKTDDSRVDSIEFTYKPEAIGPGKTDKVQVRVLPDYAADKTVSYSSSNTGVAKIDSRGEITAIAPGSTTITAKTGDGGKTVSYTLIVKNVVSTAISVPSSMNINMGETGFINPVFTPETVTNRNFTVSGSDYTYTYKGGLFNTQTKTDTCKLSDYISIGSNGMIRGLKATTEPQTGKAFAFTLTVRAADSGKTDTIKVSVTKKMLSVTYAGDDMPWYYGNSAKLTVITDSSISSKYPAETIKWRSSDSAIARVSSDGTVSCVGKGTVTITAYTSDNAYSASFRIYVRSALEIKKDYFESCRVGVPYEIETALMPGGDGEKIVFASKNEDIATVDKDGVVTFKKQGNVCIVVMTSVDTVNYKEVWLTTGYFTRPDTGKMQLFSLLKEKADSVKTSDNLPGFYRNDSSAFSNFVLTGKGTLGSALKVEDLQGMFGDLAAPKSFHQSPVSSGSTAAWEDYMANVPVRGQYMTILEGLEDSDIKNMYYIDKGSYTYDLKIVLENENFTFLPSSMVNTRHGKVFDILTNSYISGALNAINNSGEGTKITYDAFTQLYHDSSLTVSVNKITGNVSAMKYDMYIDINIRNLAISYSIATYTADVGFTCNNVVTLDFYG